MRTKADIDSVSDSDVIRTGIVPGRALLSLPARESCDIATMDTESHACAAREIRRLFRLEERAQAYGALGRKRGDMRRMMRAAALWTAAAARGDAIALGAVEPYSD